MADVHYAAKDLWSVPSLLSLTRVPLALSFPFVVHEPWWALGVIALSGLSDLADGWWARHYHQTTPTGAVLDGVTDKIFVLVVAVTLFVTHKLAPLELVLLGVRDLGELLTGLVIVARGDARALHEEQRANWLGKATTALQMLAVVVALFAWPWRLHVAILTGAVGLATAIVYARRAL